MRFKALRKRLSIQQQAQPREIRIPLNEFGVSRRQHSKATRRYCGSEIVADESTLSGQRL
jgi:hypothetical protein